MKKKLIALLATIILLPLLLSSFYNPADTDEYIIIGWNDLGMHCANKDFNSVVILPPYNNLRSQVILKGSPTENPQIVSSGVTVSYEVPGNTYSVGKTDFWDYEYDLFGVNLPDNIGLTGAGLSGTMSYASGHYAVDGVPVTPYTDADTENEDPFQLAFFTLTDLNGNQLATTQNVIPVSGEIGCVSSGCHSSEQDILDEHDDEGGFDPTDLPILCAECHADFALGTTGHPGVPSLSEAIHDKHKDKTNDCYKCHPGQDAQCFRGAMHAADMVCQDCHGDMEEVAESIKDGRRPWQDEPTCGTTDCHGSTYATEPGKLFKDSKGHGGLFCSACHGSPHADLPSTNARDNIQNIALQGYAGTLNSCSVCHGYNPTDAGPHGLYYSGETAVTLPFTETWENNNGTRNTNGDMYSNASYSWSFETNESGKGRARWGTDAFQTHTGNGALTMDKHPGNSVVCANKAILTIDLSNYTSSTALKLSFWWADHSDEEHSGDKVWIRGNNTSQWVVAYDMNPKQNPSNDFTLIDNIDIDNLLANASPSQTVSSTFQVRFGQEDNTNTPFDGISFDDISIVETSTPPTQNVLAVDNHFADEKSAFKIYSSAGNVVIQSNEMTESHKMDVLIYDMMGRKVIESSYPQNSVVRIPVYQNNCYLVVKVICNSEVYTSKVFMR